MLQQRYVVRGYLHVPDLNPDIHLSSPKVVIPHQSSTFLTRGGTTSPKVYSSPPKLGLKKKRYHVPAIFIVLPNRENHPILEVKVPCH